VPVVTRQGDPWNRNPAPCSVPHPPFCTPPRLLLFTCCKPSRQSVLPFQAHDPSRKSKCRAPGSFLAVERRCDDLSNRPHIRRRWFVRHWFVLSAKFRLSSEILFIISLHGTFGVDSGRFHMRSMLVHSGAAVLRCWRPAAVAPSQLKRRRALLMAAQGFTQASSERPGGMTDEWPSLLSAESG
jgi:hypothetical protein